MTARNRLRWHSHIRSTAFKDSITRYRAFVDESGNTGLDFTKKGTSSHFIVTAIVVPEENLPDVEAHADEVRQKHFQGGEMRSSRIAINTTRRLRVLNDLAPIPFSAYVFVVDKRRLTSHGLRHTDTFYKYIYGRAYKQLAADFPHLHVAADELRDTQFMQGFRRYVQSKHVPQGLFQQSDFAFVDSKQSVLVQVADVIGGSIARRLDTTFANEPTQDFISIIRHRIPLIEEWPEVIQPYAYTPEPGQFGEYDAAIAEFGVRRASEFVNDHVGSSVPKIQDQVACLNILLMYFRYISPDRYVGTFELRRNLKAKHSREISEHYFRSKVIAEMRDADVIIVSGNHGYKLPSCTADLFTFVSHANITIRPLIERVRRCRDRIHSITHGGLDILDRPEYSYFQVSDTASV